MTQVNEIDHLEEDAQRTREQLSNTVDTLRGRITNAVSPTAVTRDLQSFLVKKAKENPLQAAGLAAGLAFPLSKLLANIPAPILLVGAGIALSKTNVSDVVAGQISGAKSEGRTGAQNMAQRTSNAASAAIGSVTETVDDIRSSASDALDTASESLASTAQDISDTFQQYPLVLGVIGLAVGALIGGAVPVSRVEQSVFGEISDDIKQQASSLASEGLEAAKDAADEVYTEAVNEAAKQGLGDKAKAGDIIARADKKLS